MAINFSSSFLHVLVTAASAALLAGVPAQASDPVTATARDHGVRVTMTIDEPLIAGEPAILRTRVRNMRDEPIVWFSGAAGLTVGARMTEARWRLGEPVEELPVSGEPGFLVRRGLKYALIGATQPEDGAILPVFDLEAVEGLTRLGAGDAAVGEWIPPGGLIEFRHRWDGQVELESGQGQSVGLPPSGPVRIVGDAFYQLSREGPLRSTKVRLDTEIAGGWDDERLHPMEVVDAALADPGFAALMDQADFNRQDAGAITFDFERGIWHVGSCGGTDNESVHWRLAGVDPFSGEVLEIVDGPGIDASCNPGTWPEPEPVTRPEEGPTEAAAAPTAAPSA